MTTLHRFLLAAALAALVAAGLGGGRAAIASDFDPQPDPPGFVLSPGQTAYLTAANDGPGTGWAELFMVGEVNEHAPLIVEMTAPLAAGERAVLTLRGDVVAADGSVVVDPTVRFGEARGMIIHGRVELTLVDDRTGETKVLYAWRG